MSKHRFATVNEFYPRFNPEPTSHCSNSDDSNVQLQFRNAFFIFILISSKKESKMKQISWIVCSSALQHNQSIDSKPKKTIPYRLVLFANWAPHERVRGISKWCSNWRSSSQRNKGFLEPLSFTLRHCHLVIGAVSIYTRVYAPHLTCVSRHWQSKSQSLSQSGPISSQWATRARRHSN